MNTPLRRPEKFFGLLFTFKKLSHKKIFSYVQALINPVLTTAVSAKDNYCFKNIAIILKNN